MSPTFKGLVLLASLSCLAGHGAWAIGFGVDYHDRGADPQAVANLLVSKNLTHVRMDVGTTVFTDVTSQFMTVATTLTRSGIRMEAIIHTTWGYNVQGGNCPGFSSAIETQSYNEAYGQASALMGLIQDFELENEVSLYPNIRNSSTAPFPNASTYDTACGNTMAADLLGMANAIHDLAASSGRPLRTILGATDDGSWGFLKFMQQQGVNFDVVGYHTYPSVGNQSLDSDPWYGPGGPLAQLAQFGKPIHINEFDCGDIYQAGYTNVAGSASMNSCVASLNKHIPEILSYTGAKIEYLDFYELLDEPTACASGNPFAGDAASAECRFGLMYDLNDAKPTMTAVTAFTMAANPSPTPTPAPTPSPSPSPTSSQHQSNVNFVTNLYEVALDRAPDTQGLNAYVALLDNGSRTRAQVLSAFPTSAEFVKLTASYTNPAFVTKLYLVILGRAPDTSGLNSYVNALKRRTMTRAQVTADMLGSTEFKNRVL